MLTLLYIIVVLLLVLANGFLVASEFALVGVRRSRVETLAAQGNRSASRLLAPAQPPERLRSVKPTHRPRANATSTAKRWMPMRFRPDPLSNPQAGTAVAVAEVYQGVFRPHVQSAHQALQSRA
jgi:Mg2+/Co2+ transporter CorB